MKSFMNGCHTAHRSVVYQKTFIYTHDTLTREVLTETSPAQEPGRIPARIFPILPDPASVASASVLLLHTLVFYGQLLGTRP